MSKLVELGIFWLEESEIYVADKSLYETAEEFLRAVLAHIKDLMDSYSEAECGWCKMPEFDDCINHVTTSWMVHRVSSEYDTPFWENIEESGCGHRPVWYVDFSQISRGKK